MRFADQLIILEYVGGKVSKNAEGGEQNQMCDKVWEVCDVSATRSSQLMAFSRFR